MKTLYILKKYNNYFNRIVKKEANLSAYLAAAEAYNTIPNANFAIGDGVSTTHVHNFPVGTQSFEGNYLLVVDNGAIESRWFILDNYWNREGQYILTLRRDLIIDFYDEFADSGFYCERGLPDTVYDPAVFNKEPLELNQIKTKIDEIKDPSGTPWIICYVEPHFGLKPAVNYPLIDVAFEYNSIVQTITLDPNNVNALDDAPYAMIALPLLDSTITWYDPNPDKPSLNTRRSLTTYQEKTLAFLWALQQTVIYEANPDTQKPEPVGTIKIYDIQLVPYSPFRIYAFEGQEDYRWNYNTNGTPGLTQATYIGYSPVINNKEADTHVAVLNVQRAQTYRYIDKTTFVRNSIPLNSVLQYKQANQNKMVRLVDQFGSASFDFSSSYNRGNVNLLVAQTLKPWQTNVYIRPTWTPGSLYNGGTQNLSEDKRGLICRGPFTMPQIEDAWKNYAQNNVNYGKMFDRQIENIETNNAINNKLMKIQGAVGVAQSAINGYNVGAQAGNPYGAAISAVGSAGASAIGFRADWNAAMKSQAEQIDYAKDTFAMQIGNVRATPDTITSISSFDWMASWWPLIEIYSCTPEEELWFKEHLRFYGCTINHISTFDAEVEKIVNQPGGDEFITSFVRGTLLRCDLEDSHLANELTSELIKGVYVIL